RGGCRAPRGYAGAWSTMTIEAPRLVPCSCGRFVETTEIGERPHLRYRVQGEGILAENLLQPEDKLGEIERFETERAIQHRLRSEGWGREPFVPEHGLEFHHNLVERRLSRV